MKNTKRAERRSQTAKKQKQRWKNISWLKHVKHGFGKAKKQNFSCPCGMCKPWKDGRDKPFKFSERKKLIKDK